MPGNYFFGYESSDEDMEAADLEEHDQSDDPEEHEDPQEPDEPDEPLPPADEAPVRSIFRFGCSDDSDSIAAADPNEIAEPLEVHRYEEIFESEGHGHRQDRSIFREDSITAADPNEIAEPLEAHRCEQTFESEGHGDRQDRSIFREDSITAADPNEIAEPLEVCGHEQKFESEGHGDRQESVVLDTPLLTADRAHVSKIFRFGCSDDSITAAETPDGSMDPLEVSDDAGAKVPDFLGNIEDNCLVQDVEQKNVNRHVEQDVREIRALLSVHAEILDRCARNATLSEGKITIARFGFEEIQTRQTGSKLELFTRPERSERTFDISALSELPPGLEETLAVRYMDGPLRELIDYDDLFRKALILLCDDALALFLPRLREHLELALVRLEDADSWVLQPEDNASFLERVFRKRLDRPDRSVSVEESPGRGASAEGGDRRTLRECGAERALAECTVSGTYATAFDLSMGSERTRLVRFLFYVCG